MSLRSRAAFLLLQSKYLCQMHCLHFRTKPGETAADLHQTARVAGNHRVYMGLIYRLNFVVDDAGRDLRKFNCERTAETAADIGVRHLDKFNAFYIIEQPAWLAAQVKLAETVTCIVPSDAARRTGSDIISFQYIYKKSAKLVRLSGYPFGPVPPSIVSRK